MKPVLPQFEQVLIATEVAHLPATEKILARLGPIQTDVVTLGEQKQIVRQLLWQRDSFAHGKRVLWLTKGKGRFMHACPGTQKSYCCNYFVMDLVENCPFDCTYCYLQNHLTSPFMRLHVNSDDFLSELHTIFQASPNKQFRVGTGELADSLALDAITDHGRELVRFFRKYKNATLELKTKSDYVDNLLKVDPQGSTVVGWSINPRSIVDADEHGTASLEARLQAAAKVAAAGYQVAFHFDPIIRFPGWNFQYLALIKEITARFASEKIAWISLGTLRYPKGLKRVVLQRHPQSQLPLGEFIAGVDAKERYPAQQRMDVYERMMRWLRPRWPQVPIYLCMENPTIWQRLYGGAPKKDARLHELFG